MCLFSEKKEPEIANRDIECYKILVPIGDQLYTPYRKFPFPTNTIVEDENKANIVELFGCYMIEEGFFHVHTLRESIIEEIKYIQRKRKQLKLKVYKAIIPKGSQYYIGQRGDLCTKALKILE